MTLSEILTEVCLHLYIYVLYETYNLVHVQVQQIHTQSGVHALLTSTA